MSETKNFEVKVVDPTYFQLDLTRNGSSPLTHLSVNAATFGNCQLFTIGNMNHLKISKVTEEEVKELLSIALQHAAMKRLCLLDLQRNYMDEILAKLAPFVKRIVYNQPYTSTNSSEMNTVMVEFALDKFK